MPKLGHSAAGTDAWITTKPRILKTSQHKYQRDMGKRCVPLEREGKGCNTFMQVPYRCQKASTKKVSEAEVGHFSGLVLMIW